MVPFAALLARSWTVPTARHAREPAPHQRSARCPAVRADRKSLEVLPLERSICRRNSSSYRIRRSAGSMSDRVAAPAMMPAATNGDKLLGSPMTSAGIPTTPASSATVELTVTTTLLARSSGPRGTVAGSTLTFFWSRTNGEYTSAVSAGCALIARWTFGSRAAVSRRAPSTCFAW